MKYKVGDKVKIKSLDWYNANKDDKGNVNVPCVFIREMSKYCGMTATIKDIPFDSYRIDLDRRIWSWSDEMFDENFKDMETKEIIIPDGWEVEKIKGNKVILKESKKGLPKTWEECYIALGKGESIKDGLITFGNRLTAPILENRHALPVGLGKPLLALCQLLVCREVYRNGWKPDWNNSVFKHEIINQGNQIIPITGERTGTILSFQSAEIRDKFLENFKDLIDEAKELI